MAELLDQPLLMVPFYMTIHIRYLFCAPPLPNHEKEAHEEKSSENPDNYAKPESNKCRIHPVASR